MDLTKLYTKRQLDVLHYIWNHDWFICGLHGAKRAGKTVVNNDTFVTELSRVRKIADRLGVDEPIYILAGTSSTSDNRITCCKSFITNTALSLNMTSMALSCFVV